VYQVTTDGQSQPQIEALPADALSPFAEARVALEIAPWSGEPLIATRPDSALRTLTFGPSGLGMITFLILEDQRRVDILDVIWVG
jgi:hypothetical protein